MLFFAGCFGSSLRRPRSLLLDCDQEKCVLKLVRSGNMVVLLLALDGVST